MIKHLNSSDLKKIIDFKRNINPKNNDMKKKSIKKQRIGNFHYLLKNEKVMSLFMYCSKAEKYQSKEPDASIMFSRKALHYVILSIYKMKNINIDNRMELYDLIEGQAFKEFIENEALIKRSHIIRLGGNIAVHHYTNKERALFALMNLYHIVGAIMIKLKVIDNLNPFDINLIPYYNYTNKADYMMQLAS